MKQKFKSPLISESPGPNRPQHKPEGVIVATQQQPETKSGNPLSGGHSAVGASIKPLCALSSKKHTMADFFEELSNPHHPVYGSSGIPGGTDGGSLVHSLPTHKASMQKQSGQPSSSPEGSQVASFAVPECEVTYSKLPHPLVLQLQVMEGSKGVARVQTVYGGGWFHSSTMYCKLVKLRQQIVAKIASQEEKLRSIKKDWEKRIPRTPAQVDLLPQYQKEMKKLQDFQTMMSGEGYLYLITKPRIIRLPSKLVASSDGVLVPAGAGDSSKGDSVFGPENNFADNCSVDIGFENMSIKNMNQLLFADGTPFRMPEFDPNHENVLTNSKIQEAVSNWVQARRQERTKRRLSRDSSLIGDRNRISPGTRTATTTNPDHDHEFIPLEPLKEQTLEASIVSIPGTLPETNPSKKEELLEKSISVVASSQNESKKIDFAGLSQKLATAFSQPVKGRNRPTSPTRTLEVISPRRETPQTPTWPAANPPKAPEKSQIEPEIGPLRLQTATSFGQTLKPRSSSPLLALPNLNQTKVVLSQPHKPTPPGSPTEGGPATCNAPAHDAHHSPPPSEASKLHSPSPTDPTSTPSTHTHTTGKAGVATAAPNNSNFNHSSNYNIDHKHSKAPDGHTHGEVDQRVGVDGGRLQRVEDADESDSIEGVEIAESDDASNDKPAVGSRTVISVQQDITENLDRPNPERGRLSPSPRARRTGITSSNRTVLVSGGLSHAGDQISTREEGGGRATAENAAPQARLGTGRSNELMEQDREEDHLRNLPLVNRVEALEKEIRSLKERLTELESARQIQISQLPRFEPDSGKMLQKAMDKLVNLSSPPIKIDLSQTKNVNPAQQPPQNKADPLISRADREKSLKNRSLSNPQQTPMLLESYIAALQANESKSAFGPQTNSKKSNISIAIEKRNNSNESQKKLDKGSNEKPKPNPAAKSAIPISAIEKARNQEIYLGKRTSQNPSDSLNRKQSQPEQPKLGISKDRIRNQVYSLSGSGTSSSSGGDILQTRRKTKYQLPASVSDHSFVILFTREASATVPHVYGRHHAQSRPASNESAKNNQASTLSPDVRLLSTTPGATNLAGTQQTPAAPQIPRTARKSPFSSGSPPRTRRGTPNLAASGKNASQPTGSAQPGAGKQSQIGYPLPSQPLGTGGLRNKRQSPAPTHTLINQYASRFRR